MRFFLHLSYKGTKYHGWQRQSKVISVQQVIEEKLNGILKTNTYIVGCGRTDKGVHASEFYAHFDVKEKWDFDLRFRLNKSLPNDIVINKIIEIDNISNARFAAISRTYKYYLHTTPSPFIAETSTYWEVDNIDIEQMKKALALLPSYQEYRAFCLNPDKHNTTLCNVTEAYLEINDESQIVITISANRFIKAMIRKLVYCLQKIGEGKLKLETFEKYLIEGDSDVVIHSAYPQGLFLTEVKYPFL